MSNTTIIIPGQNARTIDNMVLDKATVVSSYNQLDLSSMQHTETFAADGSVTHSFQNRVGTKGAGDVNIGTINVTNTIINIPGRPAQTLSNTVLTAAQVVEAFTGTLDLSRYESHETDDGLNHVVTFQNRVGTKGNLNLDEQLAMIESARQNILDQQAAAAAPAASVSIEPAAVAPIGLVNTMIRIPGRPDSVISGMVLDAELVRQNYSDSLDLSNFSAEEVENGDTLEIHFSARTGTKGA